MNSYAWTKQYYLNNFKPLYVLLENQRSNEIFNEHGDMVTN